MAKVKVPSTHSWLHGLYAIPFMSFHVQTTLNPSSLCHLWNLRLLENYVNLGVILSPLRDFYEQECHIIYEMPREVYSNWKALQKLKCPFADECLPISLGSASFLVLSTSFHDQHGPRSLEWAMPTSCNWYHLYHS